MQKQDFESVVERVLARYYRIINDLASMSCHPKLQGVVGFSVLHSVNLKETTIKICITQPGKPIRYWNISYPIMRYEVNTLEAEVQLLAAERLIESLKEELLLPLVTQESLELNRKLYMQAIASGAINPKKSEDEE